jgi:hypothetical protein
MINERLCCCLSGAFLLLTGGCRSQPGSTSEARAEYGAVIDSIGKQYDLADDVGRRQALNACFEYANEKLDDSIDYNFFMELAADRFKGAPVYQSPLRLVPANGSEKILLEYDKQDGPSLCGNRAGLMYLSRAFAVLAGSKLVGDHFHLPTDDSPLVKSSFPMAVCLGDEGWLREKDVAPRPAKGEVEEVPRRDIVPEEIKAIVFTGHMPPTTLLSPGIVYLVRRVEKPAGQAAWTKTIREDSDREYTFEVLNDAGNAVKICFDLDDKDVVFLTEKGLKQVRP